MVDYCLQDVHVGRQSKETYRDRGRAAEAGRIYYIDRASWWDMWCSAFRCLPERFTAPPCCSELKEAKHSSSHQPFSFSSSGQDPHSDDKHCTQSVIFWGFRYPWLCKGPRYFQETKIFLSVCLEKSWELKTAVQACQILAKGTRSYKVFLTIQMVRRKGKQNTWLWSLWILMYDFAISPKTKGFYNFKSECLCIIVKGKKFG